VTPRDRKAVRVAAPVGRARFDRPAPTVVVVGAGIAGLAAATILAERGARVVVCEREDHLGGRVGGWPTRLADGSEVTMTRGFHAFFRQYYNLRALLRRVDPAGRALVGLPDYPLWHTGGHRDGFAGLPTALPWNALAFLRRSPTFRWADLPSVDARAALPLLDVSVPDVYRALDGLDAATYLERIRFPRPAHALAFEVFSRSFFAHPSHMSAAELALMFHVYFLGSAEGLLFDVAADPFPHGLWEPLGRRLAELGAEVRRGVEVRSVEPGAVRRFAVDVAGDVLDADAVVLAADVPGLRRVVAASPRLGDAVLAGPAGGPGPPGFPRHQRVRLAGQRERAGPLRARGSGVGRADRRIGRGAARVRAAVRRTRCPRTAVGTAHRGVPGDQAGGCGGRAPRAARRLPAVPRGRVRPATGRAHAGRLPRAGGRPRPDRPARRVDGTGGHHGVRRREPAAGPVGRRRDGAVERAHRGSGAGVARRGPPLGSDTVICPGRRVP
jgi:hypothetical protein